MSEDHEQANKVMKVEPRASEEDEKLLAEEDDEELVDSIDQESCKTKRKESRTKNPRKLMKAFSNYQAMHRDNLSKEMPGASRREIKRELGRRWKLMDEKRKLTFLDIATPLPCFVNDDVDDDTNDDNNDQHEVEQKEKHEIQELGEVSDASSIKKEIVIPSNS